MPDRVLPSNHECAVVEFNTAVGIWRCACGRAYRLITSEGHVRAPEHDYSPLAIDGEDHA